MNKEEYQELLGYWRLAKPSGVPEDRWDKVWSTLLYRLNEPKSLYDPSKPRKKESGKTPVPLM